MRGSRYSHDLVVVGGGAAGLSVASGCAQLGLKTALVEREHTGGDCLYFGCVPSKTLLHSAGVMQSLRDAAANGLQDAVIADTARLQMPQLNARIDRVIATIAPHDSPERFRSLGVDVYEQAGRFSDAHTLQLQDGTLLSGARIVLATGSRPAVPPIPGLSEAGFITNKDVFSLKKLPHSVITIGGGPIGVELSQALVRLGSEVTVIEAAEHILPREDADMAAIIHEKLQSEGARIISGTGVAAVARTTQGVQVTLQDGAVHEADELLLAVGRSGNLEDLDPEKAGISVERGYAVVDDKLRTSQRHIFAIGDCNGRMQFTHTAAAEAALVVKRAALHLPGRMNWQTIPWCTYTAPELASVGLNETRARAAGIGFSTTTADLDSSDRALAENESSGRLKLLYDRRKRILGVQIAGPHAGELLLPAIIAVQKRWKLSEFLAPVYPYPTISEAYKRAAGQVYSPKLFNPRVRALLRLVFGYRGGKA